jgi:hypothetical protein
MRLSYTNAGWEAWQDGKLLASLPHAKDVALFLEAYQGEEAVEVLISAEDLKHLLAEMDARRQKDY